MGGTYRAPGKVKKLCWPTSFDCCVVCCAVPRSDVRGMLRIARDVATGERAREIGRERARAKRGKMNGFARSAKHKTRALPRQRDAVGEARRQDEAQRTKRRKKRRKTQGKGSGGVGGSCGCVFGRRRRKWDGARAALPGAPHRRARGAREDTAPRRAAVLDGEAEDEGGRSKRVVWRRFPAPSGKCFGQEFEFELSARVAQFKK